jgi:hypothetical protein
VSELTVLFFALLFKMIAICAAICGTVFLAYHGKDGWGWLIFLAVLIGSTSYKYTPDTPVKHSIKGEA